MKTVKEIVEEWKDEVDEPIKKQRGINYRRETIAIHIEGDTLYIATKNPGLYIGFHGQLADKYRKILEENGHNLRISFVDLFCGNVREF